MVLQQHIKKVLVLTCFIASNSFAQTFGLIMGSGVNYKELTSYTEAVLSGYYDLASKDELQGRFEAQLAGVLKDILDESEYSDYSIEKLDLLNIKAYEDLSAEQDDEKLKFIVRIFFDHQGDTVPSMPAFCGYNCKTNIPIEKAGRLVNFLTKDNIQQCTLDSSLCSITLKSTTIR